MGTKRIKRGARAPETETDQDAEPGAPAGAEQASDQADREIAGVVAQLPQGAVGTMHRFVEGGQREWCEDVSAADFSLARLREQWGPGRYIVYWRKPDPKNVGSMVGAGSTPFRIAAHAADSSLTRNAPPDARASLALATVAEEHVKRMLDGQQLLQQMQMAVLKNLTEPRQGSELMEKILLALVTRTAGGSGPDLGQLLTLADRLASRSSPTVAMKETLELLDKARELAGEGDSSPPWLRVAAQGIEMIGRAVSHQPAALPAADGAPAPAALPAPAPAGAPSEVTALPPTAHAVFHFLGPHIPMLLRHAEADHDPTTYAGLLFDEIAPEYLAEVRDYISRPDFFDLLAAAFPAVQAAFTAQPDTRRWFEELRDDLVERIRDELEPPAREADSGGNGVEEG